MIFIFDRNLTGDVLALKTLVAGQPIGSILVGLLLVSRAIDGEKIERILANIVALIFAKLVGASCPSVTKRDDVINLDSARSVLTANKIDSFTCVGVGKRATLNFAVFHNSVSEIARKNSFARDTTATSAAPVVIKKFAIVFFVSVLFFDGESFEHVGSKIRIGLILGILE